jgi:hypothetical protein
MNPTRRDILVGAAVSLAVLPLAGDSVYSFDDVKGGWSHCADDKVIGKVVFRH